MSSDLTLSQLEAFLVVARELNMRRSAQLLHISQPALTRKIQVLESALGAQLFVREKGRLALTAEGQALLPGTEEVFAAVGECRRTVAEVAGTLQTQIRMGYIEPIALDLLPRLLAQFSMEFPGTELILREMGSLEAVGHLEQREIDLAFLRPPVNSPAIELALVHAEPLVAALPADHPIDQPRIALSRLADERFVCYTESLGSGIHSATLLACATAGFSPSISRLASSTPLLMSFVAEGHGIALVSYQLAKTNQYGVKFARIEDAAAHSYAALAHRRGEFNAPFQEVKRIALAVAAELDKELEAGRGV